MFNSTLLKILIVSILVKLTLNDLKEKVTQTTCKLLYFCTFFQTSSTVVVMNLLCPSSLYGRTAYIYLTPLKHKV
jgi:hypothetical protein